MTKNELFRVLLQDALIAEKYGITTAKAETMKFSDNTSVFFIKVLKECLNEYEKENSRASTNLKNYVEVNITEGDIPSVKQNMDTETN